jgi:peptide/nickel transport system permease protein
MLVSARRKKMQRFSRAIWLNDNVFVQFYRYIVNISTGDFGDSIRFSRPVTDVIAERLPMTIELTLFAMLFSTTVGIGLGILSALKPNSIADTFTMVVANIGVSTVFWLVNHSRPNKRTPEQPIRAVWPSVVLHRCRCLGLEILTGAKKWLIYFSLEFIHFNSIVTETGAAKDALRHLILPAVAVGTPLAIIARMTRRRWWRSCRITSARRAPRDARKPGGARACHAQRVIPVITIIGIETGALLPARFLPRRSFCRGQHHAGSIDLSAIIRSSGFTLASDHFVAVTNC